MSYIALLYVNLKCLNTNFQNTVHKIHEATVPAKFNFHSSQRKML